MSQLPVVAGLPAPGRTLVIGVVNVTPDSFSDGGSFFDHDAAVRHGQELITEGADIIDVGGESTRPGAVRVDQEEELRRTIPVIRDLAAEPAVREGRTAISVDTMRARTAQEAYEAGARLINDVSGGQADPAMIPVAADLECAYVQMHWRGHSVDMQSRAHYADVVSEVRDELARLAERAIAAGIRPDRLVLDPGFGFAKTGEHNWQLMQHLDALHELGRPLLFAASRKRFLGTLLADPDGTPRPPRGRDDATATLTAWAAWHDFWAVRVHTVRPSRDAIAVVQRLRRSSAPDQ